MRRAAPPDAHTAMLGRVRGELRDTFARVLRPHPGSVALVDFPMHENVGDLAIWAGELTALRQLGVRVAYVCDVYGYRRERLARSLGPEDPILLHGGGNFGDVWPGFQAFRERVISDFPDRRIVQLPQTIHYASSAGLERTRKALAAHGGVTLLARDDSSLRTARDGLGATAYACPDAAFALRPEPPGDGTRPVVWLRRTDRERAGPDRAPPDAGAEPVDWPDHWGFALLRTAGRAHRRTSARAGPLAGPAQRGLATVYARVAQRRVALGLRMIAGGQVLVTDRLHAHILACLIDRPNVVVDNSYGKVAAFVERWTRDSPLVHRAATHAEGLSLARALAASATGPVPDAGPLR